MRSGNKSRSVLMVMLAAGALLVSEVVGAPRLQVSSPGGLYLLAQYKMAIGDTRSGLELMDRAIAARNAILHHAAQLALGSQCPELANP